ncbi:hypothetical protein AXG93_4201s1390 [Marchantia polymorpha subsp. ruderalis]|uniref:SH3 domain-containing protein n=1 Tax=Marchantia polymorpha subsp. ruderalis TaxID=1480154 RepID=A0A176WAX3_MARPO|nr:hypothetical protein AXG93_4201s1390 [Marchantia polymorpha subsp. ruderalis]
MPQNSSRACSVVVHIPGEKRQTSRAPERKVVEAHVSPTREWNQGKETYRERIGRREGVAELERGKSGPEELSAASAGAGGTRRRRRRRKGRGDEAEDESERHGYGCCRVGLTGEGRDADVSEAGAEMRHRKGVAWDRMGLKQDSHGLEACSFVDLEGTFIQGKMDALRKQASKFREQVAKQQQAVLKQFTGGGSQDNVITDEAELQRHQQLERLYTSTRAGKHYQREIVRGVEGLITTGAKQQEVASKLSDDCKRYATESPGVGGALARASHHHGTARASMETQRELLHRALGTQVAEPLRAMVMGAPLEDARHLTQRYDRLRQEAEAQSTEVNRRQLKQREAGPNSDNTVKLQMAEAKMTELNSAMAVLGKEAAAAMLAVEAQQQRLTLQRLIAMMVSERQRSESAPPITAGTPVVDTFMAPPSYDDIKANGGRSNAPQGTGVTSGANATHTQKAMYFLAEVMHGFEAESEGELTLNVGDYVVVRQVSPTGWSEGECKGKAGWFPSTYVEQRQRVPASKVAENP